MKKLFNNPLFVGLLVALALLIIFWPQMTERFTTHARPTISPAETDSLLGLEADSTVQYSPSRIRQVLTDYALPESARELFEYLETKIAQPVAVPEETPHTLTSVKLSALWRQPGVNLAVLNGQITHVGDRLGAIEVLEITADGVWLGLQDERTFLTLGQQHAFELPVN